MYLNVIIDILQYEKKIKIGPSSFFPLAQNED